MGPENRNPSAGIFYINTGTKENPKWEPIARYNDGIEFGHLNKYSFFKKILNFIRWIFSKND